MACSGCMGTLELRQLPRRGAALAVLLPAGMGPKVSLLDGSSSSCGLSVLEARLLGALVRAHTYRPCPIRSTPEPDRLPASGGHS